MGAQRTSVDKAHHASRMEGAGGEIMIIWVLAVYENKWYKEQQLSTWSLEANCLGSSPSYHFIDMQPGTIYLISLYLCFLTCKMGIITIATYRGFMMTYFYTV